MMNQHTKSNLRIIPAVLLLAIALILTIGVKTVFHACVHEDGTEAVCRWAQQGVFACGIMQCFTALLLVIFRNRHAQLALSAVLACAGVVTILVPGVFIRLCVMPSMRCHTVMKPWVIACAIAAILTSAWNLFLYRKPETTV